jgi:hypothetical protein
MLHIRTRFGAEEDRILSVSEGVFFLIFVLLFVRLKVRTHVFAHN